MKNFYFVVVEEIGGKRCAYVDKVNESLNICNRWEASQYEVVKPCESKKKLNRLRKFGTQATRQTVNIYLIKGENMMNTAVIEKALNLLNGAKLEDLRNLLMYEREKSILEASGKKMKLAPIVKRFLAKNTGFRPLLATVMYDSQNRPIICDGYMLVRWEKEQPELKAFPETRGADVLNADAIIPPINQSEEWTLTESDKIVLENIDKYIKLYDKEKDRDKHLPVNLFGKFFDAYLVRDFVGVIGTDFEKTYVKYDRNARSSWGSFAFAPHTVVNDDLTAIILPLSVKDEEKKVEHEKRTQEFVEHIKL